MGTNKHKFEDGEKVRIKETDEIVTIDHWWFGNHGSTKYIAQYNVVEHASTWYAEHELEKV